MKIKINLKNKQIVRVPSERKSLGKLVGGPAQVPMDNDGQCRVINRWVAVAKLVIICLSGLS